MFFSRGEGPDKRLLTSYSIEVDQTKGLLLEYQLLFL
jgi:hypothetical protein